MSRLVGENDDDDDAGSEWILVHGWGFDGAVMQPLARALAAEGSGACVIDLPGFRVDDPDPPGRDVGALADAVAARVPVGCRWLGWSLGGLVALAAARRHPRHVGAVDLLASTPRFVRDEHWPGIPAAELDAFADAVEEDPLAAHRRFTAFQLAGSEGARAVLRQLRALGERHGVPSRRALADGLSILRDTDLRAQLSGLSCPVRAVLGGADPLVPPALEAPLTALGVQVHVIEGAGHVPYLSHPEAVYAALLDQPMPDR